MQSVKPGFRNQDSQCSLVDFRRRGAAVRASKKQNRKVPMTKKAIIAGAAIAGLMSGSFAATRTLQFQPGNRRFAADGQGQVG